MTDYCVVFKVLLLLKVNSLAYGAVSLVNELLMIRDVG